MQSKSPPSLPVPKLRLYYLDNARAFLSLTVLLIQSSLTYSTFNYANWPFHDYPRATWVNFLILLIHAFAMPAFFIISGFFARHSWYRSQPNKIHFWKNRLLRIALPFTIALILYAPYRLLTSILQFINHYFQLYNSLPTFKDLITQSINFKTGLTMLTQPNELWFLWYLLFFYLFNYPLSKIEKHIPLPRLSFFIISFIIPLSMVYWEPTTHVISPNSLLLLPSHFIYFLCYFIIGWFANKNQQIFNFRYSYFLAISGLGGVILLQTLFIHQHYLFNLMINSPYFGFLHQVITLSMVFLLFSLFYRYGNYPNKLLSYLADCSYWCYLTRIPLILFVQLFLLGESYPVGVKILLTSCLVQIIACFSYEILVCDTFLSRFVGSARCKKQVPLVNAENFVCPSSNSR